MVAPASHVSPALAQVAVQLSLFAPRVQLMATVSGAHAGGGDGGSVGGGGGKGGGEGGGVTGEGGGSDGDSGGRQHTSFHVWPSRPNSSAYSLPPGHESGSPRWPAGSAHGGHGIPTLSVSTHGPHAPPRLGRQQNPTSQCKLHDSLIVSVLQDLPSAMQRGNRSATCALDGLPSGKRAVAAEQR